VIGSGGYIGNTTIVNNGNLNYAASGIFLANGNISGTGSVTLTGPGSLIMGPQTYTGSTNVQYGTLYLDGPSSSSELSIQVHGRVWGNFNLRGGLDNSGELFGPSFGGNISVGGSYRQSGTAFYIDELDAAQQYDVLNVAGSTYLNGTLKITLGSGFVPVLGQTFVILDSHGSVYGRFANAASAESLGLAVRYGSHVVSMLETKNLFEYAATVTAVNVAKVGPLVLPTLTATPAAVALDPTLTAASTAPTPAPEPRMLAVPKPRLEGNPSLLTANELSMAHALDAYVLKDGFTDRNSIVLALLDTGARSSLKAEFDFLSPEALSSLYQAGFASSIALGSNIDAQMEHVHAGVPMADMITPTSNGKSIMTSSTTSGDHIGLWLSGDAEFTTIDGSAGAQGYNVTSSGVTAGLDYKICSHFLLGAYFDYVNTNASLPGSGSLRANGGKVGAYATVYGGGFYLNAMAGGGSSSFNASRQAIGGLASGSSNATDSEVHLTAGYDAHLGGFTLSPYASLQDNTVDLQGYKEHGSLAPLQILDSAASDVRSDLGVRISYTAHWGDLLVRPSVTAAWEHDYSSTQDTIYSRLIGGSRTIASESPCLGADGAIIGGGVSVDYRNFTFFVNDEYRTGRQGYSSNNINGGVRISF
jgi:uncharacterized protein with beta-barrel porin domain